MTSTTSGQKPRQRKTEQERAQDALNVATRKVTNLKTKKAELTAELKTIETDLAEAEKIRDYRAQNPALPKKPEPADGINHPATDKEPNQP